MDFGSVLKELPPPFLFLSLFILLWIAKELWENKKKQVDKHGDLLQQNTIALIELKVEVKILKEHIDPILRKIERLEDNVSLFQDTKRDWLRRE